MSSQRTSMTKPKTFLQRSVSSTFDVRRHAFLIFAERSVLKSSPKRGNFDRSFVVSPLYESRQFYFPETNFEDLGEFLINFEMYFDKDRVVSLTDILFYYYPDVKAVRHVVNDMANVVNQWKYIRRDENLNVTPRQEVIWGLRVLFTHYFSASKIQALCRGYLYRNRSNVRTLRKALRTGVNLLGDVVDYGLDKALSVVKLFANRVALIRYALRCDAAAIASLLFCISDMYNTALTCNSFSTLSIALVRFVQNINDMRLTEVFRGVTTVCSHIISPGVVSDWLALFKEILHKAVRPQGPGESLSYFFDKLKEGKDSFTSLIASPVIYKFLCLIRYSVTKVLAWAIGLDRNDAVMSFANAAIPQDSFSFWSFVTSTVIDFCDGGCQYFIEGNTNAFVHSATTFKTWANEVSELVGLFDRRVQDEAIVGPHEITCTDFNVRLDKAYRFGQEILKASASLKKISPSEYNALLKVMGSLEDLQGKMYAETLSGKTRSQPYAVVFYGPSSCGKTHLCHYTIQASHNLVSNLPFEDGMVYCATPGSEYEENLTRNKIYEIIDELGAENPMTTPSTPPNQISLLQKINTQPMTVNMAELSRKGKVNYGVKFVVGASNNPKWAHPYYVAPAALYRRFQLHIFVELLHEFSVLDPEGRPTGVIDKWKAQAFEDEHGFKPFVWRLRINKLFLNPDNLRDIRYSLVSIVESWDAFKDFLRGDYRDYKTGLTISARNMDFGDCGFCVRCDQLPAKCACFARAVNEELPFCAQSYPYFVVYLTSFVGSAQILVWLFSHVFKPIYSKFVKNSAKNLLRDGVQDAGAKMNEFIVGTNVALLIVGLGSIIKATSLLAAPSIMPQCDEERQKTLPLYETRIVGKERNKYEPLPALSLNLTCTPGVKGDHIEQAVSQNMRAIDFIDADNRYIRVLALGVHDHYYLIPWHIVEAMNKCRFFRIVDFNNSPINTSRDMAYDPSLVRRCNDTAYGKVDLAVLTIPGVPAIRNILKFFPENFPSLGVHTLGSLITFERDSGEMEVKPIKCKTAMAREYDSTIPPTIVYEYSYSKKGACMSPLLVRVNNTYTIGGLHISGTETDSVSFGNSLCVTRSMIADITGGAIVQNIVRIPATLEHESKVVPVYHDKNMFNFIPGGCATLHGEEVGVPNSNARSDARPSLLKDYVEERTGPSPYRPAEVKIGHVKGLWNNPFQKSVLPTMTAMTKFPPKVLEMATESYKERLRKFLPPVEKEYRRPLTDYETINGIPGVAFYGGINRTAGAGYGCSKKSKYLVEDIRPNYPNGVNFTADVYVELDHLRGEIYNGNMVRPTFKANLKNEMRSLRERKQEDIDQIRASFPGRSDEEISAAVNADYNFVTHEIKDARVFMGAPMLWSHEMRRLFLPVIRVLQLHNLVSECAVGINHASGDWARLFKHLTKFGRKNVGDGDGKHYDKVESPEVLLRDGEICIFVARYWLEYSERDLMAMQIMVEDLAFPLIHMLFSLVTLHGSLASGSVVTVNFNSLTNSLYMRCAWIMLGLDIAEFDDKVALTTYGDDNAFGTCEPTYNFNNISRVFKEVGYEYTPPDKGVDGYTFKDISELQYLKRSFAERDGKVFAPLDMQSINRMLSWIVDSKLSPHEHLFAIIPAVELEFYQHGREVYNDYTSWLQEADVIKEHGIVFRTFDVIDAQYAEKYTINALGVEPQANLSWRDYSLSYGFGSMSDCKPKLPVRCDLPEKTYPADDLDCYRYVRPVATPRNTYSGRSWSDQHSRIHVPGIELTLEHLNRLANNKSSSLAESYKTVSASANLPQSSCGIDQNVSWLDMNAGRQSMVNTYSDPTTNDASSVAPLGDVLSRPVKIYETDWDVGNTTFGGTFNPWALWVADSMVQSKLQHFHLLRGNLKLTIKINGSPTFAGQTMFAYSPLDNLRTSYAIASATAAQRQRAMMQYSQMLHMYVDASTSEGGCLCLPFIWPDNALNVQTMADFTNMGKLYFIAMAPLRAVTTPGASPVGTKVDITVFAHMEPGYSLQVPVVSSLVAQADSTTEEFACVCPSRCMPRFTFKRKVQPQADDEYKEQTDGIVSRPAKVISNLAARLVDAPVIGTFAQATSIAAGAVGDIAKLYGFSSPADIRPAEQMFSTQMGQTSYTSGASLVNKLTMDPKQGLSVDPRVVGVDLGDEMTIKSIACRDTYIGQFDWDASDTAGTNLFVAAIQPMLAMYEAQTNDVIFQMTPMAMASSNFTSWSGTINIRLQVIATSFNKGRLKITYDPSSESSASTFNTFNTAYTNVLDLSSSRDVTIPIRWAQKELYKDVLAPSDALAYDLYGSTCTVPSNYCNGYLGVQVLNELPRINKTTIEDQVITVLVFASAGEDFQLQNPSSYISDFKWTTYPEADVQFYPQASDAFSEQASPTDPDGAEDVGVMGQGLGGTVRYKDLVCYGDPVTSFRSLLKRFQFVGIRTWDPNETSTNGLYLASLALPNFPDPPGFEAGNYWTVKVGLTDHPYNPDKMTLLSLLSGCYVARRGGIRHKYLTKWTSSGSNPTCKVWAVRSNAAPSHPAIDLLVDAAYTYPTAPINFNEKITGNEGEGTAIINSGFQSGVLIELPATTPKRFYLGQGSKWGGNTVDYSAVNTHVLHFEAYTQTTSWPTHVFSVDDYVAAADDFSLVYFNFVPTLFLYTSAASVDGHV
ncbi:hypothetical protein [Beihai picorna-like virus 55]|uniref:hypothetical protein n=1 Tax=Beihai picorna-like virus 55 TaxID=1922600 RepID=UPI00090AB63C|nr:hypothetical protein [Beihai picorna-like virus 55]APG76686.1 hypothetical protein [Beihai picorna-like virus 55]APG78895.1 hypothetical protein [Beihai picorna-like virus 55]